MANKKTSIPIFFPCYNDSKTIAGLVESAQSVVKKITPNYQIIVIDDSSQDESREVLKKLNKEIYKPRFWLERTNVG